MTESNGSPSEGVTDQSETPEFTQIPLDELRSRRREAEREEQDLSYTRRLLHGRVDIIKAEIQRRSGHGGELIAALPKILSDPPRTKSLGQSRYQPMEGSPNSGGSARDLEFRVRDSGGADITVMSDDDLTDCLESLHVHERSVSEERARVHRDIDALSGELTRRYREGSARVEDLLDAARWR